jgi:hypothetical protein
MPRIPVKVLHLLLAALAVSAPAVAQSEPAIPRAKGGETVDVEIKMIPFYAVDAKGQPVYDLKQDEVELRVGGRPIALDTLDGYSMTPMAQTAGRPKGVVSKASSPSRHVIFLVDSAFASGAGFRNARVVADRLLEDVPAVDRLYLLTHSAARGMESKLSATPADETGKARLRSELQKLVPEIHRLSTDEWAGLAPTPRGKGGGRYSEVPTSQWGGESGSMEGFARSEYEGIVRQLVGSLDLAAADLRRLPGPKLLLIFWEGLDPELFFLGDLGRKPGSTTGTSLGGLKFSGLLTRFTAPLQALADSGTMTVLVNATAPENVGHDDGGPLRQMALTVGGLYASGADPEAVERQVATATAAYYEAGFYVRAPREAERETVEVVVHRPGVRAWAQSTLKIRETYDSLSAVDRRLLILNLVAGGPVAQRARSAVRLDLQDLGGQILGRAEPDGGRRLRYAAAWPSDLARKELDIYNVTLAPPGAKKTVPTVLKYDSKESAEPRSVPLEIALDKDSDVIWGIVAVERGTGKAWYRRLELKGEKEGK